jgi:hypothetical protein
MAVTGNMTASALLSLFEGYHLSRINAQGTQGGERDELSLLQHHTEKQLAARLNGIASEKTIRVAINILAEKGFISIRKNPSKPSDRTKYFLFNPDVAQAAIDQYKTSKSSQDEQSVILPEGSAVILPSTTPQSEGGNLKPGLSAQSVILPEGFNANGKSTATSGKSTVCTYIYKSSIDKEENKNCFGNVEGSEEEKDPSPQPPFPQRKFEHPAIVMERKLRGESQVRKSGYIVPNPWNVDNDPNKLDPEFKTYLMDTSDFITFGERPSEIRVEQWVGQANKDEARRTLVMTAWAQFDSDRKAKAAREEDRKRRHEENHPDNNVRYKRFSQELEKLPGFRVEASRTGDYAGGLRVKLFHESQGWEFYYGKFGRDVSFNLHRFWNSLQPANDRLDFEEFIKWFDSSVVLEWEAEQKKAFETIRAQNAAKLRGAA